VSNPRADMGRDGWGSSPCPFEFEPFYEEHGWLSPARFGFAMALTMLVWNSPKRCLKHDREHLASLFKESPLGVEDVDVVLDCAFWVDDGRVYSPWVQKWAGVPNKRTPIPRRMRSIVRCRDMWNGRLRCAYCSEDCTFDHQYDHMLPLSRGGIHHPDNLCISCPTCNQRKGGMTDIEFMERLLNEEDAS
jgi:hypothetical protein